MKHKIEYYYYPMSIIIIKNKKKRLSYLLQLCNGWLHSFSVVLFNLAPAVLFSCGHSLSCPLWRGYWRRQKSKEAKMQSFTHSLKDSNDTISFSINNEIMSFINTTLFCSQFNNWFMETASYDWFRLLISEFTGSWLTTTTLYISYW